MTSSEIGKNEMTYPYEFHYECDQIAGLYLVRIFTVIRGVILRAHNMTLPWFCLRPWKRRLFIEDENPTRHEYYHSA